MTRSLPPGWKSVPLGDLLTPEELKKARILFDTTPSHQCAQVFETTIFTPLVMARINAKTSQENHAKFFAYALFHAFESVNFGESHLGDRKDTP